jgi:phage-related protein
VIPKSARVLVRTIQGDITVHGSDEAQIQVSAKKKVRTWSEAEANRGAQPVSVQIVQNGDGYEVRPSGYDPSDARISVDLEVSVPKKSPLAIKTDKGDGCQRDRPTWGCGSTRNRWGSFY